MVKSDAMVLRTKHAPLHSYIMEKSPSLVEGARLEIA